jgi:hypothetical protein
MSTPSVVVMNASDDEPAPAAGPRKRLPWNDPERVAARRRKDGPVVESAAFKELVGILGRARLLAADIDRFLDDHGEVECSCPLCTRLNRCSWGWVRDLVTMHTVLQCCESTLYGVLPPTPEEMRQADAHAALAAAELQTADE